MTPPADINRALCPRRTEPPRRPRGRVDLHHARGRRRVRATRRCCSRAARTRSSCCASPRRRSARQKFPFPVMHVDTGPQLPRGARLPRPARRGAGRAADRRLRPGVASTRAACRRSRADPSRNRLQTTTLLDAIQEHQFDAVFGGAPARRGEGARQGAHLLVPRRVRAVGAAARSGPSCGTSTTASIRKGQHMRVFPISNWTEMDVWQYIQRGGPRGARRSTSPTSATSSGATACGSRPGRSCPPRRRRGGRAR